MPVRTIDETHHPYVRSHGTPLAANEQHPGVMQYCGSDVIGDFARHPLARCEVFLHMWSVHQGEVHTPCPRFELVFRKPLVCFLLLLPTTSHFRYALSGGAPSCPDSAPGWGATDEENEWGKASKQDGRVCLTQGKLVATVGCA